MISSTCTLTVLAALAFASNCMAVVSITNPIADTLWTIGEKAKVEWKLDDLYTKKDVATIYLVGGDHVAYKRIVTLGENVKLNNKNKFYLNVNEVPNVDCMSSCAIEIFVKEGLGAGDFYSHNFTIATRNAAHPTSGSAIPPAEKSTSASGGSTQENGPITLVQNAVKGAQLQSTNVANGASNSVNKGAFAMALTAVIGATMYLF